MAFCAGTLLYLRNGVLLNGIPLCLIVGLIYAVFLAPIIVATTMLLPLLGAVPELAPGDLPPQDFARRVNLITSAFSAVVAPFQVGLQLMMVHELKLRRGPTDRPETFKGLAA